jgi:hypothetical protein
MAKIAVAIGRQGVMNVMILPVSPARAIRRHEPGRRGGRSPARNRSRSWRSASPFPPGAARRPRWHSNRRNASCSGWSKAAPRRPGAVRPGQARRARTPDKGDRSRRPRAPSSTMLPVTPVTPRLKNRR